MRLQKNLVNRCYSKAVISTARTLLLLCQQRDLARQAGIGIVTVRHCHRTSPDRVPNLEAAFYGRRRGTDGGSACCAPHPSTESESWLENRAPANATAGGNVGAISRATSER